MAAKWRKIGEVGVDSGQLVLTDPCYIDGYWKNKPYTGAHRAWQDKDGTSFSYTGDGMSTNFMFPSFNYVLHTGKTANQHIKDGDWEMLPRKDCVDNSFSYNGCCDRQEKSKQINYELGHAGLAVVFSTGWGDGTYDVEARENSEGRIVEVRVRMG